MFTHTHTHTHTRTQYHCPYFPGSMKGSLRTGIWNNWLREYSYHLQFLNIFHDLMYKYVGIMHMKYISYIIFRYYLAGVSLLKPLLPLHTVIPQNVTLHMSPKKNMAHYSVRNSQCSQYLIHNILKLFQYCRDVRFRRNWGREQRQLQTLLYLAHMNPESSCVSNCCVDWTHALQLLLSFASRLPM